MITQEYAKQLFDIVDGHLVWKVKKALRTKVGERAGTTNDKKYVKVIIDNKSYLEHRVIFLMEHGYMPTEIDHKNRIKSDNRISNLTECSRNHNMINRNLFKNNKTGIKNVHKHSFGGYEVSLRRNNKSIYIGLFDDIELAELVALEAAHKLDILKAEVNKLKGA